MGRPRPCSAPHSPRRSSRGRALSPRSYPQARRRVRTQAAPRAVVLLVGESRPCRYGTRPARSASGSLARPAVTAAMPASEPLEGELRYGRQRCSRPQTSKVETLIALRS